MTGSRSPIAESTLWLSIRDEPKLPCTSWTNQIAELLEERSVETELLPDLLDRLGRRLIAGDDDGRVARQKAHQQKREDRDDQDDRDGLQKLDQRPRCVSAADPSSAPSSMRRSVYSSYRSHSCRIPA